MNDKKKFFEIWFQRVWAEEDTTAIEEMMRPDVSAKGLGGQPIVGVEEYKEFHAAICALLSDIRITIDRFFEDGDWASAFCTVTAKSKSNGKPIKITGSVLVRFENGKILEGYNQFDFMSLWGQLELLPIDSFEQGLQGKKIV